MKKLRAVVKNKSLGIVVRTEAFEDIIDLEVGDTNLARARTLEREYDIRQLFIKYEGNNPSGTQKDRIAFAQVLDAIRRGFNEIALATCGNYGVACAYAASLAGLTCKVFMPSSYHSQRTQEIENLGAELIRLDGTYSSHQGPKRKAAIKAGQTHPIDVGVFADQGKE